MKTSSFSRALRNARRRALLFFLFLTSYALTLAVFWCLTLLLREAVFGNCGENWKELFLDWNNRKELHIFALVLGSLWFGYTTCFKFFELKWLGACGLAEELGGRPISKENPIDRRFFEIVEEIACEFDVPVPRVYVLRDEKGINACVVGGGDLNTSAIVATEGALRALSRDELRGVVAHEFGHLLNGDVKLNMGLIWTLASLRTPTCVGLEYFQQTGNCERGGNNCEDFGLWLFTLFFFVVGLPGFLGTKLVRAVILRSQERLADRFAAKHTRDPLALAGALKKMGGAMRGTVVTAPRAVETAHLFFGSIWADGSGRMFRTYPALNARILALDPDFDGKFPTNVEEETEARELGKRAAEPTPFGLDLNRLAEKLGALIDERKPLDLTGVEAAFGEIPEDIKRYLTDFDGARTVIFAILLDRKDRKTRRSQLEMIRRSEANVANDDAATLLTERVEEAARALAAAKFTTRAALVRLTVPALKSGTRKEYERFRSTTEALCNADGQIDLLEFALQHSTICELDVWFKLQPIPTARFGGFGNVNLSTPTALSYLAFCGANGDEEEARRAFAVGAGVLARLDATAQGLEYQPFEGITLEDFKKAIDRMSHVKSRLKKNLLAAFFACVTADGRITEEEAELFDAISLALGAPEPIWQSVVDWAQMQAKAS